MLVSAAAMKYHSHQRDAIREAGQLHAGEIWLIAEPHNWWPRQGMPSSDWCWNDDITSGFGRTFAILFEVP